MDTFYDSASSFDFLDFSQSQKPVFVLANGKRDIVSGSRFDDFLFGGEGDDYLNGADGDDFLFGDLGDDRMDGGRGQDILLGGGGADFLIGMEDDDKLDGGTGGDTLSGGDGNDRLTGGTDTNRDTFQFAFSGFGHDVVTDFQSGIDKIELTATGIANFAGLIENARQVGDDVVITFNSEGLESSITLMNLHLSDLRDSDFAIFP